MTDWSNTLAVRLMRADREAKANFEKEDLDSPVGACPARQAKVFVVPVRYSLAERAAEHPGLTPACAASSHAMALRRLRPGYLYLWHRQGPLARYAVAADGQLLAQGLDEPHAALAAGSLAGLALDKNHEAWLLYTERPLPPAAQRRLAEDADERRQRMRRLDLPQVALNLQAEHCPPLDNAEQVLAELMPDVRDLALAHDHAVNGEQRRKDVEALGQRAASDPGRENIEAYAHAAIWLGEAEQAAARHPQAGGSAPGEWSAQPWDIPATDGWLMQARHQAGVLWGVFAALDDDLGVLRDLDHEQELNEARHERWLGENAQRTAIAGFIRSLTRLDGAEAAGLLNYRYREHEIVLTPEQGDTLLDVQRELRGIRAKRAAMQREEHPLLRGNQATALLDESALELDQRREAQLDRVRPFLPVELQAEALAVVSEYRHEKIDNLSGGHGTAQIAERIALWRMDDWLDNQAPAHYALVERRHERLYADRERFLPRHVQGTWFADHRLAEHQDWLGELAEAGIASLAASEPKPLLGLLLILRLNDAARFARTVVQGATQWQASGQLADALKTFTDQLVDGIRQGTLKQVQRWEGAKRAGGVLPLAVLALNIANAQAYARAGNALEAEGEQRRAERLSAYLYTGAALCSVVQNFVMVGMGRQEIGVKTFTAPTLTLFGGVVGGLSALAALKEFESLQAQINQVQKGLDPYLDLRRFAVQGQGLFYASQGMLGFSLTSMRMAGMLSTAEAIQYFRIGMAPLNWLLLAAGGLYLYAWWQQESGLQTFLSQCCWGADASRRRWDDNPEGQADEFLALLQLLYSPQVQVGTRSVPLADEQIVGRPNARIQGQAIDSLTLALPAAEPGSAKVGVRLYGERDLGHEWANSVEAAWIPADAGQGLLLSGRFRRPVSRLEVQIGYHSPLPRLSGAQGASSIIGGPRGVRFAISADGLVTPLHADDPTPRLEACEFVTLAPGQLIPKEGNPR